MTASTVREVPTTSPLLKIRAAEAGRSLQTYLLALVTREATQPTLAETLDIPFVTTDPRIKRGVPKSRCAIEVIGAEAN